MPTNTLKARTYTRTEGRKELDSCYGKPGQKRRQRTANMKYKNQVFYRHEDCYWVFSLFIAISVMLPSLASIFSNTQRVRLIKFSWAIKQVYRNRQKKKSLLFSPIQIIYQYILVETYVFRLGNGA